MVSSNYQWSAPQKATESPNFKLYGVSFGKTSRWLCSVAGLLAAAAMYRTNDLQAELTRSESYPFIPTLAGIQTSIPDTPEFYRVRDAKGKNQYIKVEKVEGVNTGVKFSFGASPFEVSGLVSGRKFFDMMRMEFPEQGQYQLKILVGNQTLHEQVMNVGQANATNGIRVSYPYNVCLKCDPGMSRHLEVHLTKKDINGKISSDIICLRNDQPISLKVPDVKTLDL